MQTVKIFTNSCSDLSPVLAEEFGVSLVPDTIIFDGTKEYRTNIDITPQKLYKMMEEHKELPTSSHPNISVYEECFRTASQYEEILCITLTSKMSGTYSTACTAADFMNRSPDFAPKIHIYDSLQVSYGLSIMVLQAARMAKAGKTASEIISYLDAIKDKIGVYFVLSSLQNAKKGGRVGAIRVLAADLLGVKPLLMFRNGTVKDIGIMRNYNEGLKAIVEKYRSLARPGGDVFVFHSDNLSDAELIKYRLREWDTDANIMTEWVGSAIGIYTGRGCVGISFIEK